MFIEFRNIKGKNNVRATITKNGELSFTEGVIRKFAIDRQQAKFSKLYFDPADKKNWFETNNV